MSIIYVNCRKEGARSARPLITSRLFCTPRALCVYGLLRVIKEWRGYIGRRLFFGAILFIIFRECRSGSGFSLFLFYYIIERL